MENKLPNGWKVVRLGDYVTTEKGKKPLFVSQEKSAKFPIPYVNIKAFEKNIIDEYTDGAGCVFCEDGDFLMVWDGSRSGFVGRAIKGAVGSTLVRLDFPDVSKTYAFYFLFSKFLEINTKTKGTGTPHVDPNLLWNYSFPIPPPEEQERIVAKIEELFSELDAGFDNLKKAQAQLKIYRQAVLKAAFDGKLTNEHVSDGNLPEGWKKMTIGDVVYDVEYGTAAKSKRIGKVPVLRMGNIQNGRFDWTDLAFTDDADEIEKYLLKKDDVLFNRTNSPEWVGKTALFKGERKAIFAGYLIRLNRIETLVDASYLTYFLNSHDAKLYGNSVKTFGVNQANINGTKLKSYPLNICPLEEQQRVVEEIESRLSVCDKLEETIVLSLRHSELLRQSILKQAFEGRLLDKLKGGKTRNVYFEQMEFLGDILWYSGQNGIRHTEMTAAKYAFLLDRLYDVPTTFEFERLHLGPYPRGFKKIINNPKHFTRDKGLVVVNDWETLHKYNYPGKELVESAVNDLASIFKPADYKKRNHKTELLATVCKVVEDIGLTDLTAIRKSMEEWPITLKNSSFHNKAEKFAERETADCIAFIKKKGWDRKLIDTHGSKN